MDDKRAHELALAKSQYTLVDQVLYRVESDKTLSVIHESHGGRLGAHL